MTKSSGNRANSSWIKTLLRAFKLRAPLVHSSGCSKSKKFFTIFCIDCLELACKFCHEKASNRHRDHLVLPLYRASGQDSLKKDQLCKLIDISDVHLFIFNESQIVYLNRRNKEPRPRNNGNSKNAAHRCEICGWELQKDKRFCSLECKDESGQSLSLQSNALQVTSLRKTKRKGIPRRAPFF